MSTNLHGTSRLEKTAVQCLVLFNSCFVEEDEMEDSHEDEDASEHEDDEVNVDETPDSKDEGDEEQELVPGSFLTVIIVRRGMQNEGLEGCHHGLSVRAELAFCHICPGVCRCF